MSSVRVLLTTALLVALIAIANPAAAQPGAEPVLDTVFASPGPGGDVGAECAWWWLWC